jgi:hypothetical protein
LKTSGSQKLVNASTDSVVVQPRKKNLQKPVLLKQKDFKQNFSTAQVSKDQDEMMPSKDKV